ncbi:MAG TPA: transposase [Thermoanaerobaculia bacterium]|nr:transposase [Thermoanaerobaculia bacterium]
MRGPRYLPEPSLVEITVRTIQSRFLLVLTKIVAETIIGVIARAQERYGVSVIDVKQMSSHLHLLCFFKDGDQMASFMRYVNSNVARKVGRLIGWRGPFWERRYSHVVVTNEKAAQVERLVYLLRKACGS